MTVNPDVDVWPVWLTASPDVAQALRALLSPDEASRAARFVFDRDRLRYELSQAALRLLLSPYLNTAPRKIAFSFGPKGKPAVAGVAFNKSHSGLIALYAVTSGCEVGVDVGVDLGIDVELLRHLPDADRIAASFFHPAEANEILSFTDPAARQEAFFRCWTRKEAYVKAIGDGLHIPLDQFQVTLLPEDWNLHQLQPAPGYIGALAYRGSPKPLHLHPALDCGALLEGKLSAGFISPDKSY
jgi:4'-phosphopantetheinyl transferase